MKHVMEVFRYVGMLPKDPSRRKEWLAAIRRDNYTPGKQARLCSKHFRPDDFDRTSLCYVRLRDSVVPSIFEAFPSHLQKKTSKRKPPKSRPLCDPAPQEVQDSGNSTLAVPENPVQTNSDSMIRSKGGFNNNPSARQFLAAYKRVLTHSEIQEVSRGNCMPLESVPILTTSSHYLEAPNASVPSSSVINHSLHKSRVLEAVVTDENKESELSTHAWHNIVTLVLSEFQERIVFSSLAQHMLDSEPVTNHVVLLIKAVAETYLQVSQLV
ncbi:THAP domain-containing protein 5-like [Scylla paramamosain]|uniref:THAP domain-containing protein 5-like n=1 Tax=Scylla paramamosain TaxID=85552 RepID=UPI0030832E48